ncbi:TPA: hypothetical protein QB482_002043, partial [Pasteurella multocida]|nr:hypothetical protein [Pasteurella multocida]HDR1625732.1 hypothetical protein [Pasteurella multocida]
QEQFLTKRKPSHHLTRKPKYNNEIAIFYAVISGRRGEGKTGSMKEQGLTPFDILVGNLTHRGG